MLDRLEVAREAQFVEVLMQVGSISRRLIRIEVTQCPDPPWSGPVSWIKGVIYRNVDCLCEHWVVENTGCRGENVE